MPSDNDEAPCHYSGPSTSESSLAGALGPPQPAKNPAEQNQLCHYSGPSTSESSLAGALGPLQPANNPTEQTGAPGPLQPANNPAEQHRYSNCPRQPCLYLRDGNPCNTSITCDTAPEHFRIVHGIRDMPRGAMIVCQWENCEQGSLLRHNFIRHIRTVHMDHPRQDQH
ncbi:hypothetical protein PISMIDRAFT_288704 [Pisolithus microcarpus 441]|uniref:Uncharacterized protein n=1 Tax=Pisolithus microcarpus 441 TaxID=765257 RepID=A0A0C9Z0J7_9AGAM|nr:hypothetical protein BKA83DRAFT_288704 [Pisolithus microcarpus]KIK15857.1 hypothetical protein PISMIDRAFT_288704 [Pisolithus microcarpus 441]